MRQLIAILVFTSAITMPAQHFNRGYDTEPVSSYDVAVVASAGEYAGTYLFGDTEFEWTLVIDIDGSKVLATYSYRVHDEIRNTFRTVTKKVKNAKIHGFIFQGDGFLGTFLKNRETNRNVLVLVTGNRAPSPEIGFKSAQGD